MAKPDLIRAWKVLCIEFVLLSNPKVAALAEWQVVCNPYWGYSIDHCGNLGHLQTSCSIGSCNWPYFIHVSAPHCLLGTHRWSLVTTLDLHLGWASSSGRIGRQPAGLLWYSTPYWTITRLGPNRLLFPCLVWKHYGCLAPPCEWFVVIVALLLMLWNLFFHGLYLLGCEVGWEHSEWSIS